MIEDKFYLFTGISALVMGGLALFSILAFGLSVVWHGHYVCPDLFLGDKCPENDNERIIENTQTTLFKLAQTGAIIMIPFGIIAMVRSL